MVSRSNRRHLVAIDAIECKEASRLLVYFLRREHMAPFIEQLLPLHMLASESSLMQVFWFEQALAA